MRLSRSVPKSDGLTTSTRTHQRTPRKYAKCAHKFVTARIYCKWQSPRVSGFNKLVQLYIAGRVGDLTVHANPRQILRFAFNSIRLYDFCHICFIGFSLNSQQLEKQWTHQKNVSFFLFQSVEYVCASNGAEESPSGTSDRAKPGWMRIPDAANRGQGQSVSGRKVIRIHLSPNE